MAEAKKFRAIKGVRDILPLETSLWNWFEQTAREVLEAYNYREIRLPVFEHTQLFARSIGEDTDVVSKEMYTFEDGAGKSLEHFRSVLSHWLPKTSPNNLLHIMKNFLVDVDMAFSTGEIPRTDKLDERIAKLHGEFEQLEALLNKNILPEDFEGGPPPDMILEVAGKRAQESLEWQAWISRVSVLLGGGISFADVLTLRPEATASVVRAYIEHGMHTLPGDVKLYYVGPMFRRERPQKGRFRQFYQIGAEVLGQSDHPAIDAEVIEMLLVFFERVGLAQTTLYINSIGCKNCRPAYVAKLREALQEVKEKLGPDSQRRIETNPLRVLDSKLPEEQAIIEKLPRISDHLCSDCRAHFAKLQDELKLRGIRYEINWRLVRGLDYYTRTTFEVTASGLGAQDAVCGGGRYDGLVELLGGPAGVKGIGFAIGTDRAILSIQQCGKSPAPRALDVFVAWMGAAAYPIAVRLARRLREEKFTAELPAEDMKLKKFLGLADKLGARFALILGEDEVASGRFTLKRLADAQQKKLTEAELVDYLKAEQTKASGAKAPSSKRG